jgi:hypothetical protein
MSAGNTVLQPFSSHDAYNAIYSVKSVVLLHQYFPKYMCSVQYGCFL